LHSIGTLYVASRELDAFSEKDDILILRMMGRVIAEQLVTYQNRNLVTDNLSEMVAQPQVVDSYFKEFRLESEYIKQLEEWLRQIKPASNAGISSETPGNEPLPFHDLASLAVDLSTHSGGADTTTRISEKTLRELVKEIGKEIKRWAKVKSLPIEIYYMYEERYCILLRNVALDQVIQHAAVLQEELLKCIQRKIKSHHGSSENVQMSDLHLHLGIVGYTYTMLQELLAKVSSEASARVRIMHLLNNALKESKDTGENTIVSWHPQDEKFVYHPSKLNNNGNSPLPDKNYIKLVANEVYSLLKREKRLRPGRENQ
jgi:hypothetical protein